MSLTAYAELKKKILEGANDPYSPAYDSIVINLGERRVDFFLNGKPICFMNLHDRIGNRDTITIEGLLGYIDIRFT